MTNIAAGASLKVNLTSSGTCVISTNGGSWSASVTPVGGVAEVTNHGPTPSRRTFGPYGPGGATLTLTNNNCDSMIAASTNINAALFALANQSALSPIAAALRGAVGGDVIITGIGDSLTEFGGDTTAQTSDTLAEQAGYLACLRRELNARMGLAAYDGGQWIAADAVVADTRVANGGSPPVVAQFNPYVGWRNSGSAITERKAISLESGTHTITFTFTGRYLNVMQWENAASSYNGTFSYNIDAAGANNVVSSGAQDTYRMVRIDCTTNAAHTVVLTWVSAKVLIAGAMVTNGAGVSTARFGVGSTTATAWVGRAEKQQRTSFKTLGSALQIIRFGYNDWSQQVTSGTTPGVFRGAVSSLIALALANPSTKAVLLLADAPTSTPDTLASSYDSYRQVLQSLATGSVAFMDLGVALNASWATGNTSGYYVDFVHRTAAGYAAEASMIASALLDPGLLATP